MMEKEDGIASNEFP